MPSAPAAGPAAIIARLNGSSSRPALVGLRPKPNPSACRNPGTSTKNAVIEKPSSTVLALVAAIAGRSRLSRSTSGSSTRRSIATQPVSAATLSATSASTPREVQPHSVPSLSASSRLANPTDSAAAPL